MIIISFLGTRPTPPLNPSSSFPTSNFLPPPEDLLVASRPLPRGFLGCKIFATRSTPTSRPGGEPESHMVKLTKIGISSRWFKPWPGFYPLVSWRSQKTFKRVTFSPSQQGHKQNCQDHPFVKKKRPIAFQVKSPMLELLGGWVGWSFSGMFPGTETWKNNDPGTFVFERFQKKRPLKKKNCFGSCLWTYAVWKVSSKIQWKVRPFAGNNWLWEWSNPLKDPNFRGGWQKSGSEWPKKVCMQPKRNTSSWTVGLPGNFFSALLKRWLSHTHLVQKISSWWFQPLWKIWSSNWISSPIFGVKIKNLWVATTQICILWIFLAKRLPIHEETLFTTPIGSMEKWYICLHENHRFMPKNVGKYPISHGSVMGPLEFPEFLWGLFWFLLLGQHLRNTRKSGGFRGNSRHTSGKTSHGLDPKNVFAISQVETKRRIGNGKRSHLKKGFLRFFFFNMSRMCI